MSLLSSLLYPELRGCQAADVSLRLLQTDDLLLARTTHPEPDAGKPPTERSRYSRVE